LNEAVVLDHSRYLRAVLQVDSARGLARVQPGAVLDELRTRTQKYGWTFGPDPSTHDRCTFGGMIGNNACGIHAVQSEFYGPGPRTDANVQELEVLTYDGARMRVGRTSDAEYEAIVRAGGRKAEIYRALRDLRDRYADRIREGFPELKRRVSGYNLPALLPEHGFHVAAALVGSEGTCVTVTEATVRLTRHFPALAMLAVGYPDVYEAAADVVRVREFEPIGIEGMDDLLVHYVKKTNTHAEHLPLLPEGGGWLLVEFGGQTREEAVERARACQRALEQAARPPNVALIDDPQQVANLWQVREAGLGATAFVPGQPAAWEGWEDSAVPVERLADYLRDLKKLYGRYDLVGSVYGHFGQGCLHTRITFDLATPEGIRKYRAFTREASELCVRYGGSLSGEHGDGQQRSDLLHVMYDDDILRAFQEFKSIWDPQGKMNPGRIVEPLPRDEDLRLGPDYHPWKPEVVFAYPEDGGDFSHAALRCVGVGLCRKTRGGTMCPSYMVTLEEEHSTRGRARLLFEMVRGDLVQDGWRSEEVKHALDLCLSCKACKTECPVNVDMATYKAEFFHHYYAGRLRPRQAYAFGLIHRWAQLASHVPRLANFVTHAPGLGALAKWAAGMAPTREVPRFAPVTFRRAYDRQARRRRRRKDGAPQGNGRRVILWPDTFNNHFVPRTLHAAQDVLERAGVEVVLPPRPLCCGRPLYEYGMLDVGRKLFQRILDVLEPEVRVGTPLVGVEPSCVVALRDELPNMLPHDPRARRLSERVYSLEEYLQNELEGYEPPVLEGRAVVQLHCQGTAILGRDAQIDLLTRTGLELEVLDSGCCGMAGAFGYEQGAKHGVSVAAAQRMLLPALERIGDDVLVIADGFSCREQIRQLAGRRTMHVADALAAVPTVATKGEGA
jgi:FAD/FMN-containing dehydrogenase/Fe-S oxidoreductase